MKRVQAELQLLLSCHLLPGLQAENYLPQINECDPSFLSVGTQPSRNPKDKR